MQPIRVCYLSLHNLHFTLWTDDVSHFVRIINFSSESHQLFFLKYFKTPSNIAVGESKRDIPNGGSKGGSPINWGTQKDIKNSLTSCLILRSWNLTEWMRVVQWGEGRGERQSSSRKIEIDRNSPYNQSQKWEMRLMANTQFDFQKNTTQGILR